MSEVETGMAAPQADRAIPPPEGVGVRDLRGLVLADLDPVRRALLREQPFRLDWVVAPEWPGSPDLPRVALEPAECGILAGIGAMTSAFTTADRSFGGGHARVALTAYLATDVAVWLRAHRMERSGGALLSASATLVHLAGFMCFDDLHHNLAQRYFRMALELTAQAGDPLGHAAVLRSMSAQAWFLGHHRQAVLMAEAALARAGGHAPPGTRAELLGQAAVAHAALSNRDEALARLTEAEESLDGARRPTEPTSRANLAHQAGQVLALLGDRSAAQGAWRASLRHRPVDQRRSRMITTHRLAELHLRRDRVEQACATWQRFVDEYPYIHSARVDSAHRSFLRQLRPYRDHTCARRILDQAATGP
ncbi:hypothetical protein L6E12_01760 [Actinokineospora sp. PR83]|uniref:hypothetical protein n=1 Tax=Actinokineospora sp. PR83 TaxID=2884908 RepID=UPI001F3360A7|nr:hypothetical protein [Actinokineospora sp. PR83]MCG8914521.1 hypothetical protein [Actinokineospora sp. PR83]